MIIKISLIKLEGYTNMLKKILIISSLSLLFGCSGHQKTDYSNDPMKSFNRKIYSFNKVFDGMILKPLAVGYKNITPVPINSSITSFFDNLNDIRVVLNDIFQFDFSSLKHDFSRFFLNTTFGVLGLIDVASSVDLDKRENDFGVTLGKWGVKDSNYLVLPFLGASTIRDTVGVIVDAFLPGSPFRLFVIDENHAIDLFLLQFIDLRAGLLGVTKVIDTASIDEYAFVRDAYLQRRAALIGVSSDTTDGHKKSLSDATNMLLEDENFGDEALFADAMKEESEKKEAEKKEAEKKEAEKKEADKTDADKTDADKTDADKTDADKTADEVKTKEVNTD